MNEEEKLKNKEVCDKLTELFSRDVRSMTRLGEAFSRKGVNTAALGNTPTCMAKAIPLPQIPRRISAVRWTDSQRMTAIEFLTSLLSDTDSTLTACVESALCGPKVRLKDCFKLPVCLIRSSSGMFWVSPFQCRPPRSIS